MDIITQLRIDSEEWIAELSEEEMYAIRKYSYNSFEISDDKFYSRLNAMLRGDIESEPVLEKYANIISNAVKKSVTKRHIMCYRRVNINPVEGYNRGDFFRLDQFISTSVVQSRTLNGKYTLVISVPPGKHAAYIEKLSYYPRQRELLLDKDCIYKLISVKDNVIKMEVIS